MPTYQYRCAKCSEQFDLWQSIHDDSLQEHPGCGGKVTKVLAPAGIVLKGSGFYRNDSRSSSSSKSRDSGDRRDTGEKTGEKKDKVDASGNGSTSKDSTKETSKSTTSSDTKSANAPSKKDAS